MKIIRVIASKCEVICQGVTPSNSKGGLPAPEAGACAREKGIEGQVDSAPSQSEGLQDIAESLVKSQNQEVPLRRKQRVGATPSH